jgi:hypothetical protein
LKFEHLSSNNQANKKNISKKTYFSFEVQSLIFLNFNIKNTLHLKSSSNTILSSNLIFAEEKSKNNFIFLFFIFFFILFFILFFIDQSLLNLDNANLLLVIKNQFTDFYINNCFKTCNLFFNDLLISIIQELE